MSFLLKIVQGPNAGAEIALVEGTTISLGRGDACDIILTDAALDDKACDLEVTGERVMMLFPDGKQQRMEPFHAYVVGTTAFALGPAAGAWREIVWEKPRAAAAVADADAAVANDEQPHAAEKRAKGGCGARVIFWLFLLLLLLLAGGAAAWHFFPQRISALTRGQSDRVVEACRPYWMKVRAVVADWFKGATAQQTARQVRMPVETLADVVGAYGLQTNQTAAGAVQVTGDFKTRVERLQATARIYDIQPGAELDFADAESLKTAVENVLALVTEGRMRLVSLDGRAAKLAGVVSSAQDLRRTLEAISQDVPKLVRADCSGVTVGGGLPAEEAAEAAASPAVAKPAKTRPAASPALPVVGVLTMPYPCLVLRNGSRVMEGARFGDWTVRRITADSVELGGAAGTFTWRP